MKKYNVAIIGLGKIALGYDLNDPVGVKTHAKAFLEDSNYQLLLGVDPFQEARNNFEQFSKSRSFSSIEEIPSELADTVDIVAVATPSFSRVKDCKSILTKFHNVKYVILEKPIALTLNEIDVVENEFKEKKLIQDVFVNYMRRCDPHFIKLRERIRNGEWGEIQKLELCYPDTVINMGSHFIDLINFFFDLDFKVISKNKFEVYPSNDFKAEAELVCGDVNFKLWPSLEGKLELLLKFEKETIKIYESGRKITIGNEIFDVDSSRYQEKVVDHLNQVIQNGLPMLSDFFSAKKALVICDNIRNF